MLRHLLKLIQLPFRYAYKKYVVFKKIGGISDEYQNKAYADLGLSRKLAKKKLDETLSTIDSSYNENNGMMSEHLLMFSAISISNLNIRNILEIGTYDGRSTRILSKLFPTALVRTIDLPANSTAYGNTYDRQGEISKFNKDRQATLNSLSNVEFVEINSIMLTLENAKYDLIWIDGAHGYPFVAMDIVNAIRCCSKEGFIMIDDVITSNFGNMADKYYHSPGAIESLDEVKAAGLIKKYNLLHKRVSPQFNLPWTQKFVGIFQPYKL